MIVDHRKPASSMVLKKALSVCYQFVLGGWLYFHNLALLIPSDKEEKEKEEEKEENHLSISSYTKSQKSQQGAKIV